MKEQILFLFLLLCLIFASIGVGYYGQNDISSFIRKVTQEDIETPEQCNNLSMRETSHCLNDYISSIFKYKIRDDSETPTLQELINEGGDCKDWTDLYMKYTDKLNFHSKAIIIDTDNRTTHTFMVLSDETGYCKLDQVHIDCFMFN